jgi:hypothetical protein
MCNKSDHATSPCSSYAYLLLLSVILFSVSVYLLQNLFKPFRVIDAFELLLGANLEKEDAVRLNWKIKGS